MKGREVMKLRRLKQINVYTDSQIGRENILRDKINELIDVIEEMENKLDSLIVSCGLRGIKP